MNLKAQIDEKIDYLVEETRQISGTTDGDQERELIRFLVDDTIEGLNDSEVRAIAGMIKVMLDNEIAGRPRKVSFQRFAITHMIYKALTGSQTNTNDISPNTKPIHQPEPTSELDAPALDTKDLNPNPEKPKLTLKQRAFRLMLSTKESRAIRLQNLSDEKLFELVSRTDIQNFRDKKANLEASDKRDRESYELICNFLYYHQEAVELHERRIRAELDTKELPQIVRPEAIEPITRELPHVAIHKQRVESNSNPPIDPKNRQDYINLLARRLYADSQVIQDTYLIPDHNELVSNGIDPATAESLLALDAQRFIARSNDDQDEYLSISTTMRQVLMDELPTVDQPTEKDNVFAINNSKPSPKVVVTQELPLAQVIKRPSRLRQITGQLAAVLPFRKPAPPSQVIKRPNRLRQITSQLAAVLPFQKPVQPEKQQPAPQSKDRWWSRKEAA